MWLVIHIEERKPIKDKKLTNILLPFLNMRENMTLREVSEYVKSNFPIEIKVRVFLFNGLTVFNHNFETNEPITKQVAEISTKIKI